MWTKDYVSRLEEFKTATCKDDADWKFYRNGQLVGMCHTHIRDAYFFTKNSPGSRRHKDAP